MSSLKLTLRRGLLFALLIAALLAPAAHAQPTPPTDSPQAMPTPEPGSLPALKDAAWRANFLREAPVQFDPAAAARLAPAAPGTPNAAPTAPDADPRARWSRLVYYSYRDGNAEIYATAGDGTAPVRVTNHPAADVTPQFNLWATRIAFISNRDGNPEIYTVNPDGTDLRRVTYTPEPEADVSWSPDGGQLVYSRPAGEGWDLFIINADGSGARRLTTDGGRERANVYPAWSPTGRDIAFVKVEPYLTSLWLMAPDGSGARRLAGARYGSHLSWSPRGDGLLFSADLDNDWWNEVVWWPLNGYSTILYDADEWAVDAEAGSLSPDDADAVINVVVWNDNGAGEFTLAGSLLMRVPVKSTWAPVVVLPGSGADFGAKWVKDDWAPPSTHMLPLPELLPVGSSRVRWSGTDTGSAGIARYELQVRENGGQWRGWLWDVSPNDRSALYKDAPGGTALAFRVRAIDAAGNAEAWRDSPNGDANTRLYSAILTGRTYDVRGYPLPGATVTTKPSALEPIQSVTGGLFSGYLGPDVATTATAARPGYSTSGARPLDDHRVDLVLPGPVNLIAGGDFASAAFDPAWRTTGAVALSAPPDFDPYAEPPAAALGQPGKVTEAQEVGGLFGPPVAGPDGSVHIVTAYPTVGDARTIAYAGRTALGQWTPQEDILRVESGVRRLQAVADSRGGLYLAWQTGEGESARLQMCYLPADVLPAGAAGACVPTDLFPGSTRVSRLALDNEDGLHLFFSDPAHGLAYTYRAATDAWSAPEDVSAVGALAGLVLDGAGRPHVLGLQGSERALMVATRGDDGWRVEQLAPRTDEYGTQRLGIGPDGSIYAAWQDFYSSGVHFSSKRPDGSWQTDRWSGTTYDSPVAFHTSRLNISLITKDWSASYALFKVWRFSTARGWQRVGSVDKPPTFDYRAVPGPDGNLHVTYVDQPGSNPRYYSLARTTATTVDALAQTVRIPPDMHRPTLAFRVNAEFPVADRFTVTADTGSGPQPLDLHTGEGVWQDTWADLGAYAGQTVTLRFALEQPAGAPLGQVHLDDVSVSAWLTPVIDSVEVDRTALTIRGENFMDTATVHVDGAALVPVERAVDRLAVTLTAPFGAGSHKITVTNPGGAAMTYTLRTGLPQYLPRVLR